MSAQIRLILTLHLHQPVGNFDGVCESAYRDSYVPFLDVLQQFPELVINLHVSGSLLDWLAEHHPEYLERLREFVGRGQIELLGGPYYEPILACLPRRDRIGQIRAYRQTLEERFGSVIRGAWIPERVWEQSFAADLAEAGIEYTLLDDAHFLAAGLTESQLAGYYLTEDGGQTLKVFAGSERLRYQIPYAGPHEVIQTCRQVAERQPNAILVFGDDGEKFGVWPESKQHVFEQGWLRRFFQALRENSAWLQVTTMGEAVDHVSPQGLVYLPDGSYREMTEWALPTDRLQAYREATRQFEGLSDWQRVRPFLRAGFWRNFLVKYPEAREMYTRMLQVSDRLHALSQGKLTAKQRPLVDKARTELYRAQCNCPYWHGAFGGLYLPHLRNAIYEHLIRADGYLDTLEGKGLGWVSIDAADYNLDARKEVRLAGDRLIAFLAPTRGGHLYELDSRGVRRNLLATLNRRPEPYHAQLQTQTADERQPRTAHSPATSAATAAAPTPRITYDQWPRKSLVDHFLQPGLAREAFANGVGRVGDFEEGIYQSVLRRATDRVEVRLSRDGNLGPYRVRLTKTVAMVAENSSVLSIVYELEQLPSSLPIHFAVEFNFASLPGGASDRFYYGETGRPLGTLDAGLNLPECRRLGLVDEWLGLDVSLEASRPTSFWTMPIETVSQSEKGIEAVHQSCAVVPHWEFHAPQDGRWSVEFTLTIDTAAAHARQLAESGASLVEKHRARSS